MKSKWIIVSVALALLCVSINGHCITSATEGANRDFNTHSDRYIENIIIDKMDSHHIYSKSGKVFTVTSDTKIVRHLNKKAKIRTAELLFRAGKLVKVTIK